MQQQKKICMLVRNNFLHDTRVLKEARTLADMGYIISIIALKKFRELPEEENIYPGINVYRIPIGRDLPSISRKNGSTGTSKRKNSLLVTIQKSYNLATKPFRMFRKYFRFAKVNYRVLRKSFREKADIYHAHDLNMLFEGFISSKLVGAKLVYDSHELFTERNTFKQQKKLTKYMLNKMETALIGKCDAVITVSHSISKYLADKYDIPEPFIVRNCQKYESIKRSTKLYEVMDIDPKKKIVLYFGRITFNRGLEGLIESAKYLDKDIIIMLIGNGERKYISKLQWKIYQDQLYNKVMILPPVSSDEANMYVSSASIGIIPTPNVCLSYYYAASNKLFHYMMAGLPILVSDHPEKRNIVLGSEVGDVIDPDDPENIAKQINRILSDETLFERYSENCLKASLEYNWEKEERKLIGIYDGLYMLDRIKA